MGQVVLDQPGGLRRGRREDRPRHPVRRRQDRRRLRGLRGAKARRDGTTLLDFDDLLLHTAAAIENDAAVAQEFRDRYRCFVVDEYQDVTPLQQRVLNAWLGERDDLTVVGDANQTIYSFTGATPSHLLDFSRRFPDAAVVRLERDYRSTPQVVSLANRVIGAARGRMAGSRLHLVGQREPGPAPTFNEHPDEVAEATAVAKGIRKLIEAGTAPSEIAVLYRINAQSEVYEEALTEAGVPSRFAAARGSSADRRSGRRCSRCSAPPNGTREGELPELVRAVLEPLGLTARGARGHQGPRAMGGAHRARRTRRRGGRASARRSICAHSWPSCASARMHGTHRSCRASRWPRCTRRRGWSGTRCSWSAWPTAHCPSRMRSPTAPRARQSRRSVGCSTSE